MTIAVVPGALQRQGAEGGGEGLVPAPGEARLAAALAGQVGSPLVGSVGVEPPSDGAATPQDLNHWKSMSLSAADQPRPRSRSPAQRVETPLFSAAVGLFASSRASQIRPLTSTSSRTRPLILSDLGPRLFDGIGRNGAAPGLARIPVQPGQQPVRAMTLRACARAMAVGFAAFPVLCPERSLAEVVNA